MNQLFKREFQTPKVKILLPVLMLLFAANVFSQVWGDAPQIIKRGRQIRGISNLMGETESVNRQCIPAGRLNSSVVKINLNESGALILSFALRRERNQPLTIYLSETLERRLDVRQLQLVRRLLNAKSRLEVGMASCRVADGSLLYATSIQKL